MRICALSFPGLALHEQRAQSEARPSESSASEPSVLPPSATTMSIWSDERRHFRQLPPDALALVDHEHGDAIPMSLGRHHVLLVRRNARRGGDLGRCHYDVIPTTFFRSSRRRTELVCSSRT